MDIGDAVRPLASLSSMQANPPTINTAFFAADLNSGTGTATNRPWPVMNRITITIALSLGARLALTINGGPQLFLNSGTALTANCLYAFSFGARPTDTYNLQLDTASVTVEALYVEAVCGGN